MLFHNSMLTIFSSRELATVNVDQDTQHTERSCSSDDGRNSTNSSSSSGDDDSSTGDSDSGESSDDSVSSIELIEESKATAATSKKGKRLVNCDLIVLDDSSSSEDNSTSEDSVKKSSSIEILDEPEYNKQREKARDNSTKLFPSKGRINAKSQLEDQAKNLKQTLTSEQFIPLRSSPRKREYISIQDDRDSLTTEEDSRDSLTTEQSCESDEDDLTVMAKAAGLGESSESSDEDSEECMELLIDDCDVKVIISFLFTIKYSRVHHKTKFTVYI